MNSRSAPRSHGSVWDWLFRRQGQRQDTGWQREREQPAERNTDGMPPIQYPLHQHEQPVIPVSATLANHPRWRNWLDEQPVLEPRLVEKTDPKKLKRAGHTQEIRPKLAEPDGYQWPHTNPMQRLDPADLDFLQAQPPDLTPDALPIRRVVPAGYLATMRPSYAERRYGRPPVPIEEVPTIEDIRQNASIEAYLATLPPWRASDPPANVPDEWLNSRPPQLPAAVEADPAGSDIWPANTASVQMWAEPDVDDPIEQEQFDPDRTLKQFPQSINANLLGVTEQDCAPDLGSEEEGTAQASALLQLRFCEHKKEEDKCQ